MKTKLFRTIAITLAMVMCLAVGAFAATNLQEIKAYLNYDLAIRYDGELQTMYDANGSKVVPISYNGTTYLPIRAVGNMMGIDVLWDAENYQVLLGKTGQAIDFIENFTPYAKDKGYQLYKHNDGKHVTLGSKTYTNMIYLKNGHTNGYYDLAGKYSTLTFDVYSDSDYSNHKDITIFNVYGDNDTLIETIEIKISALPQTYNINVEGVQQLRFELLSVSSMWIFNATIE